MLNLNEKVIGIPTFRVIELTRCKPNILIRTELCAFLVGTFYATFFDSYIHKRGSRAGILTRRPEFLPFQRKTYLLGGRVFTKTQCLEARRQLSVYDL